MSAWSEPSPIHGAGRSGASLDLTVHILRALHDRDVEHTLGIFVSAREVLVVHVAHDGSAWSGWSQEATHIREMKALVVEMDRDGEREMRTATRLFDLSDPKGGLGRLLSGILMSLAEPAGCTDAALLCRDIGEDPGWIVARHGPGRVDFLETDAEAFVDELVQVDQFARRPHRKGGGVKPTLVAASMRAR